MYKLQEITSSKIDEIIKSKKNIELEIPANVAKFQDDVPNIDFSFEQEMAPSPIAFEGSNKWLFIHLAEGEMNRVFIRLVLEVYDNGGKIFYQKSESGDYIANIKWN